MYLKGVFVSLILFCYLQVTAKDEKVVLKEYKSVYEFSLNRKTGEPMVKERLEMFFEAMSPNADIVIPSFYDENSSLSKAQILDTRGKLVYGEKVCGNYEDRDIFYSDTKFCAYRFVIGDKGETARFSTSKEYYNARYFTSIYFPSGYKIQQRIIEFHIPEWLNLELKEFNLDGFGVKRSETVDARKKIKIITYTVSGLAAYDEGPLQPGKSYTYPHLLPVIKSYQDNSATKPLMSSTSDLYKWYFGLVQDVKDDRSVLAAKVEELVKGKTSDADKIKSIYYWVQDNIRYIAFEDGIAGFKPESCQKVYQNRYGDCKGMANLTKQMLILAGFDARLAWVGTNHLVYTYEIPSLAVDNHMVCTVVQGKDYLVLDATEKFISLHDYAERIQGKELLIENKDNYLIHKVPVLPNTRNKQEKLYTLSISNGALAGKGRILLHGETRTSLLQACNNVRNEGSENLIRRSVVGSNKNMQVKSLNYSSLSEREKAFAIDFDLHIDNNLMAYNQEYYFQPDLSADFTELEIDKDRVSSLYFKEKINQVTEVRLEIPKGYNLSYLPKDLKIDTKEFSFFLSYKKEGEQVVFTKKIVIPSGTVSRSYFEQWNTAIKSLKQHNKEQIVLTKI